MNIFEGVISIFMAAWLALSGVWHNTIGTSSTIVDNAASVALSESLPGLSGVDNQFLSLLDIINSSLQKLTDGSLSSSTVTIVETATSTKEAAAVNLDDAIVNIFCSQETEGYKKTVSGTGFFISPNGVVLTNAHVGQFFLLEKITKQGSMNCYIRSGEEAAPAYEVDLLYISPSWLLEHADLINNPAPKGSGENDFALLYVTGDVNGKALDKKFPYLPPATSPMTAKQKDSTVILVGYPSSEQSSGRRVIATTTITDIYTFKTGYADIFALSESILGHQGASGGPVVDHLGRAIGVISTKDVGTTILNAITMAHIDRAIKSETGYDLISTLQGDLGRRAVLFNETVSPILQQILKENLE